MKQQQRRLVGIAMTARARQWKTRLGLGVIIAGAFFTMTGAAFAVGWLAVYFVLQILELRLFRATDRTEEDPARSSAWCACAAVFIAVNNFTFGAFAVRQAFVGQDLGLVASALLISGAIVNGVIVSAGSRLLTWASIGPQIACFCALSVAAMSVGHSGLVSAQIAGASLLFVLAAAAASNQLANKLKTAEDGRRAAESASVSKSQFLANMSHEIRTPLNGVVSMAALLGRSDLTPADREMVQIIRTSGDTLTVLLSDILDMARIEAGEVTLEQAPYHFGEMTRSACTLFSLRAQEKGVILDCDVSKEADRFVLGDGGRVRQVVNNLISNAVKFTSAGRVCVNVDIEANDRIRLCVTDTGVGFDPEASGDLFGRFQQADGSITRRFGGTGLGLAISRDLIALMEGQIGYASAAGQGSRFWIELPFLPCDPPETGALAPDAEEDLRQTYAVLVADDHAVNLRVASLILEQIGADCTLVSDGAEAVAAFQTGSFDLVLMDMQMPVMDGLTAIREIRAFEGRLGRSPVQIAVVSANAMPEHVAAAMEAGADAHLAKPIKPADLIEFVKRATA